MLDPTRIIRAVEHLHRVPHGSILTPGQGFARYAKARQAAYWCCRQLTGYSYPELGRLFGRDHTTVMHGRNNYVAQTTLPQRVRLLLQVGWWPEPYQPLDCWPVDVRRVAP